MKLIIEDGEGRTTVVPVARAEITIGRQAGNTIRLTDRNISRRHARLVRENGTLLIEDLGSFNGVRVNGEKIDGRSKLGDGDVVEIGDYDLGIEGRLDTPASPLAVRVMTPAGSAPAVAAAVERSVEIPKTRAAPESAPASVRKSLVRGAPAGFVAFVVLTALLLAGAAVVVLTRP
ncbi:MAG TPA: FHA domain-containing protein [Myxococcales bacterium]